MTVAESAVAPEKPSAFSLWLNGLPFLMVLCGLGIAVGASGGAAGRVTFFALWIYLAPPFFARLLLARFGRPEGRLTQEMPAYRVWWALTQLQMIFNRLPALEETLRLVPGLYALWIFLWGGRLSPFAYVAPGVKIIDRPLVDIGRGAVLGFSARLAGHIASRDIDGRWFVVVAPCVVEDDAVLGGESAMAPGTRLRAASVLPYGRKIGIFGQWPRQAKDEEPQS